VDEIANELQQLIAFQKYNKKDLSDFGLVVLSEEIEAGQTGMTFFFFFLPLPFRLCFGGDAWLFSPHSVQAGRPRERVLRHLQGLGRRARVQDGQRRRRGGRVLARRGIWLWRHGHSQGCDTVRLLLFVYIIFSGGCWGCETDPVSL